MTGWPMKKRKPQLTEKALIDACERPKSLLKIDDDERARNADLFIAGLCGVLECDHPRAAHALADAAGMGHLYDTRASL